jgi:prepilin-type N-terminal cleavage/methylation domain-containing protein
MIRINMPAIRQNDAGFTLVEMAIVLMIVGLLLGGLLVPLSVQIEQRHITDTQKSLSEIKEAIIGYAIVNGKLPCPAPPNLATGNALAGVADCSLTRGVLPWATLGVSETDAWGRRFSYTATSAFINSTFTLATAGTLSVKNTSSGSNIASGIPAIIVSHGKNGLGAYTSSGSQITVSSDPDEAENSDADAVFVSHESTTTFDDLVDWISPNILFNRMVAAGKLP